MRGSHGWEKADERDATTHGDDHSDLRADWVLAAVDFGMWVRKGAAIRDGRGCDSRRTKHRGANFPRYAVCGIFRSEHDGCECTAGGGGCGCRHGRDVEWAAAWAVCGTVDQLPVLPLCR